MNGQGGYTLVELMIVIAIIGMLAAIGIPQCASMIRKGAESRTKGNLAAIRAAIGVYVVDHEGQYPTDDLTSLTTGGQYLADIPLKSTPPYHPDGNSVSVGDEASMSSSHGDWFYFNVEGTERFGQIVVNCTHTDARGAVWTSY